MGWLTSLVKGAAAVASPLIKSLPVVGTIAGGVSIAQSVFGGGSSSGGLPGLPGVPGGFAGLPGAGDRSIFRNDPNVSDALKGSVISMAGLKTYYRAPPGYVIRHDEKGDPMGVPKVLARKMPDAVRGDAGWRPAKKPPISVRNWEALKHAHSTMLSLKRVNKMAHQLGRGLAPRHSSGGLHIQPEYRVLETKKIAKK